METTPSPTPTKPAPLSSRRSSSSLASGNACSLTLVTLCYITPGYGRVFTNSTGTTPFNGLNRVWNLQIDFDSTSISATVDTNGFIIAPLFCP